MWHRHRSFSMEMKYLISLIQNLSNKDQYQGKRICITAGSRGIPHRDVIIRTVVAQLKMWGAKPVVIPAMGSHGGGRAEGQRELIASYNITEEVVEFKTLMMR